MTMYGQTRSKFGKESVLEGTMKKRLWVSVGVAAATISMATVSIVAVESGTQGSGAAVTPVASPAVSTLVAQLAGAVKTRTGVEPTTADVYQTTRGEAAAVGASTVGYDNSGSVTVVVFTGNFTDSFARIPRGANAPSGSTITFVVDPSTGVATDYSIGPALSASVLGSLGAVEDVSVGATTGTSTSAP
jgi:hypothetical protein